MIFYLNFAFFEELFDVEAGELHVFFPRSFRKQHNKIR